jgi:hypothetical protein
MPRKIQKMAFAVLIFSEGFAFDVKNFSDIWHSKIPLSEFIELKNFSYFFFLKVWIL